MLSAPTKIASALLVAAMFPQDRGTDLVTVDVQVVDRDSNPISTLGKGDFEVTIDGRARRVMSSEFISASSAGAPPRAFFLAVDAGSFEATDNARFARAANGFAAELQPTDVVGLFTLLPQGPFLDPTVDRAELRRALDVMAGRRQDHLSQFNLSPSEVLDIVAESAQRGNITRKIVIVLSGGMVMSERPDVAAASGGSAFFDQVGSGDVAFGRILQETAGYYVLGVEPAQNDPDGRGHKLSVKANARGVTVRSRQWVVVASRR